MKRKKQQEKVTSKTLPSSSLICLDGSGYNDLNTKSIRNTSKQCSANDTNNLGVKLEEADSCFQVKIGSNKSKGKKVSSVNNNDKSISSLIKNAKSVGESKQRVKLKAKRKCGPTESTMINNKQKSNAVVEVNKNSNDTLQMKLLKEKILLRQIKGNASKKSKIIKDIEVKKEPSLKKGKKQLKKPNDGKSLKINSNSQIITRKVKKEQILKFEEREKSIKLRKLADTSKQIDQKSPTFDKKLKINRYKENTTSETNKVSPVSKNKRSGSVTIDGSSLGLSISSSSANSNSLMKQSKYVIPKLQNTPIESTNNSNEKDIFEDLGNKNMSPSASQSSKETSPCIYKNAEERLKALRERLEAQISKDKLSSLNDVSNTSNVDSFYEEMEWEPIEEEKIIFEVQAVRAQLGTEDNDIQMIELPYNDSNIELTTNINHTNNAVIYVVIDTNVLLSSIETVEKIRDTSFEIHGKPIIIIPWTVIRELDFIKDDKLKTGSESLKSKARQAVRFLYHHFSTKHPQIKGQKFQDVINNREQFAIECPDDEILQTCLQIRSPNSIVVLLSFDKNLCNKAMIHDVITLGKDDSPEKINCLFRKNKRRGRVKRENDLIKEEIKSEEDIIQIPTSPTISSEESTTSVDDIFEESKNILTAFLTVIVSFEMKNLFGDDWEKYTILKPPWTAITVLKCAIKHWIAAVNESFLRKAEPILKELLQLIIKCENYANKQLKDVQHIIELFNDLIQCVNDANKYQNVLRRSTAAIAELRNKCMEKSKQLAAVENGNAGMMNLTKEEQEMRATAAFQYFENIYVFTRNFCGAASEIVGIPCSFQYNKSSLLSSLSDEDIKRTNPDIAGNLNQLLQALRITLGNIDEIRINHQYVTALYQLLTNFLPKITEEFTQDQLFPTDIYYCLKHMEKQLRCGVGQLLELSNHFSRMAQLSS